MTLATKRRAAAVANGGIVAASVDDPVASTLRPGYSSAAIFRIWLGVRQSMHFV